MNDAPAFTIRQLLPDEWISLRPTFVEQGSDLPHPEFARILVAERDGTRIGFLVIQLVPHLEPIYVEEASRGTGVSLALAKAAQAQFPAGIHYYAFVPNPTIEALAIQAGLTKRPWAIYEGTGD